MSKIQTQSNHWWSHSLVRETWKQPRIIVSRNKNDTGLSPWKQIRDNILSAPTHMLAFLTVLVAPGNFLSLDHILSPNCSWDQTIRHLCLGRSRRSCGCSPSADGRSTLIRVTRFQSRIGLSWKCFSAALMFPVFKSISTLILPFSLRCGGGGRAED